MRWVAMPVPITADEDVAEVLEALGSDARTRIASVRQGLRAILNTSDSRLRVVATRGEFDSLDVILREYARREAGKNTDAERSSFPHLLRPVRPAAARGRAFLLALRGLRRGCC